jgi:beta-glucosidase
VVQLYIGFKHSPEDRPVKALRGFTRVDLESGQSRLVELSCPLSKQEWYNPAVPGFEFEHMEYEVYIGTSSADQDLLADSLKL